MPSREMGVELGASPRASEGRRVLFRSVLATFLHRGLTSFADYAIQVENNLM